MLRFILIIFLILFYCAQTQPEQAEQIVSNTSIKDKEAISQLANLVFGKTLKEFEISKRDEKNLQATIEYGGSSPLTFLSQKNYAKALKQETAKYIFRLLRYGNKRNLDYIRCSLVKPLYVNDPMLKKESVEEFEIFRIYISIEDLKNIKNWDKVDPFLETSQGLPTKDVVEVLKKIIQNWKVELDEFNRIKVK